MKKAFHLVLGMFIVSGIIFITGCQKEAAKPAVPASEKIPSSAEISSAKAEKTQSTQKTEKKTSKNAPCIKFENSVHDFGIIGPDTTNKCQFKFSNVGKSVLKIESIQSTCGCTVPELAKKEYDPGESGAIDVTFHSGNYGASLTKHLYAISNDPETPRAELTIKANVQINVVADPNRVELVFNKDNAGLGAITVKSRDGVPFAITRFSATGQAITCAFDSNDKKTEHILNPVVDMKKVQEVNTGIMQIGIDHPQTHEITVGFNSVTMYDLRPARIILQNTEPGVITKREVWVINNYDKPFEIESISSRNGYMKVVNQKKDGINIGLDIEITPPQQQEPVRRYITDELNVKIKDGPVLTIRCSGWFKLK